MTTIAELKHEADCSTGDFAQLMRQAASELETLQKEVDGIRDNAPKCGACAEGLFCGSTMHQHDADCVYTERDSLRTQNHELRKQLQAALDHAILNKALALKT